MTSTAVTTSNPAAHAEGAHVSSRLRRITGGEAGEHDHDEERSGGDDAAAALQADGHGEVAVPGLVVDLLDAGEQEDLVVHRQAEGEDQDQHGHPQIECTHGVEAEDP